MCIGGVLDVFSLLLVMGNFLCFSLVVSGNGVLGDVELFLFLVEELDEFDFYMSNGLMEVV